MSSQVLKVSIVGKSRTGKTYMFDRLIGREPEQDYAPTMGVEYAVKINPGTGRKISLWDVGGSERLKQIRDLYISDSEQLIVTFSLKDKTSLAHAKSILHEYRDKKTLILVGTHKSKIREGMYSVTFTEGQTIARLYEAHYIEVGQEARDFMRLEELLLCTETEKRCALM